MKRIISVSRRTDIPAFYGDWFMNRLRAGFAGVVSPFGGRKYIVSLQPQDVVCFVFWSKNFGPFIEKLQTIEKMGYRFYFNYTITALADIFEYNVNRDAAIKALKQLSKMYCPAHINWRYDPIVISSVTDHHFYIENFEQLARELAGYVERCYFSYVVRYDKVMRNFAAFQKSSDIQVFEPDENLRVELANKLAQIASNYGIQMFSCCGDYLVGPKIKKAHCIDARLIEELHHPKGLTYETKPTRQECGCTESTDIGTYDTCPHGCVYCYANADKQKAFGAYKEHDPDSAFLGYSKSQSDKWVNAINRQQLRQRGSLF